MICLIRTNIQKKDVVTEDPVYTYLTICFHYNSATSRGSFHVVESFLQNRGGMQSIFHIANLAT